MVEMPSVAALRKGPTEKYLTLLATERVSAGPDGDEWILLQSAVEGHMLFDAVISS